MSAQIAQPPADRLSPVISRVDISWICVATNDGHPLHLDFEFATKQAGFKDVLVPGHMLIGWTAEFLQDWIGAIEGIERWQIRFVTPVWPGEQLTLHGEALAASEAGDHATVTLTAQDGRVVGKATARFKLS